MDPLQKLAGQLEASVQALKRAKNTALQADSVYQAELKLIEKIAEVGDLELQEAFTEYQELQGSYLEGLTGIINSLVNGE